MDDRTENEELAMLWAQIPHHWTNELTREEARRNNSKFWVRITNITDMATGDIRRAIEQHGCRPREIKKVENGFEIRCVDEDDQVQALRLNGARIGEKRLKVIRAKAKLNPDEIFKFIGERIQMQEENDDRQRLLAPRYSINEKND